MHISHVFGGVYCSNQPMQIVFDHFCLMPIKVVVPQLWTMCNRKGARKIHPCGWKIHPFFNANVPGKMKNGDVPISMFPKHSQKVFPSIPFDCKTQFKRPEFPISHVYTFETLSYFQCEVADGHIFASMWLGRCVGVCYCIVWFAFKYVHIIYILLNDFKIDWCV